jgi:Putative adhesin
MKRLLPIFLFSASALLLRADDSCTTNNFHSDGLTGYAQTREQTLPAVSENYINPGANGSIRVHGWTGEEVRVKACIQAAAPSEGEAQTLASQVAIADGPGMIRASGPSTHDRSWWSVSYEVWVPNAANVKMEANNGSIGVDGVRGQIHFHTQNGSVRLSDVGGDVDGETTNGSLTVELAGTGWSGSGLRVQTTNGSVKLNLPESFSARLEVSTVNGKVHTDFPVTVSGEIQKNMSFVLGSGGATIEARTVNGSVHIGRRS